jgi:predicted aconitase with swiveling domain
MEWDGICFYLVEPEPVVQLDGLHQLLKHGVASRAMVVQSPDTVLVAGAVITEISLVTGVDSTFHERVSDGQQVAVDGDDGWLVVR